MIIINREMTESEFKQMKAGFDIHTVDNGVQIQSAVRYGFVSEENKVFVGCSSGLAYKNGDIYSGWFYLTDLFVEKAYRSQGVGAKLLRSQEEQIIGIGVNVGKIQELGLSEIHNCHEICESYLKEDSSDRKMLLPANFDQGILGYLFSPASDRMIVYSSYDGPDFEDYYEYRAEIVVFTISSGKGLDAINYSHSHYTKTCSIEDLVWLDNETIALQIYEAYRPPDETRVGYKYVNMKL